MEELKLEAIKKVVKIGIIIVIVAFVLYLSWVITQSVMACSYSTKDVLSNEIIDEKSTELPNWVHSEDDYIGGYTAEEFDALSEIEKTIVLMNEIPTDDLEEASVKKSSLLLSCSVSPYCKYMSTSTYEVGKVSKGYKVDYKINGKELSVICSWYDATPVVFIKDVEFTDVEKEFFRKVGRSWEVQLDDGTYSIQYR